MSGDLRALAAKVTPGRWKSWGMSVMADQDGSGNVEYAIPVASTHFRNEEGKPRTFDADWIIATQPDEILALLDERDALAVKVARVEALANALVESGSMPGRFIANDLRAALRDHQ